MKLDSGHPVSSTASLRSTSSTWPPHPDDTKEVCGHGRSQHPSGAERLTVKRKCKTPNAERTQAKAANRCNCSRAQWAAGGTNSAEPVRMPPDSRCSQSDLVVSVMPQPRNSRLRAVPGVGSGAGCWLLVSVFFVVECRGISCAVREQ